jgi:hypothetical protein
VCNGRVDHTFGSFSWGVQQQTKGTVELSAELSGESEGGAGDLLRSFRGDKHATRLGLHTLAGNT